MTKFRGFTIDTKQWVYGYYVKADGKHFIVRENAPIQDYGRKVIAGLVDVSPESIGQFTGLHDKNGKEIYGGDIIIRPSHYAGDYWYKEEKMAVEWDDSDCNDGPGFYLGEGTVYWKDCEVIGNATEHPSLLKGEQE